MSLERDQTPGYNLRYIWFAVIAAIVFGGLLLRLWFVQIIDGEKYARLSAENIVRNIDVRPERGTIFDRNGVAIADNRASFDVYFVPKIFRRSGDDETLLLLASILDIGGPEINRIADRSKRNSPLSKRSCRTCLGSRSERPVNAPIRCIASRNTRSVL